jgi:hypothetical protein
MDEEINGEETNDAAFPTSEGEDVNERAVKAAMKARSVIAARDPELLEALHAAPYTGLQEAVVEAEHELVSNELAKAADIKLLEAKDAYDEKAHPYKASKQFHSAIVRYALYLMNQGGRVR